MNATIVVANSEKEQAAATFKHPYGYQPILAFLDNSGEFEPEPRRRPTPRIVTDRQAAVGRELGGSSCTELL